MRKMLFIILPVLIAVLGSTVWAAEDLVIVNGGHWEGASLEQKRAYLFGIGNMLEVEEAMAGDDYEAMRGHSIVPVLLEGLSGTSIANMVTQLDKFYAANPDQVTRPVIEILYLEMALPNL